MQDDWLRSLAKVGCATHFRGQSTIFVTFTPCRESHANPAVEPPTNAWPVTLALQQWQCTQQRRVHTQRFWPPVYVGTDALRV